MAKSANFAFSAGPDGQGGFDLSANIVDPRIEARRQAFRGAGVGSLAGAGVGGLMGAGAGASIYGLLNAEQDERSRRNKMILSGVLGGGLGSLIGAGVGGGVGANLAYTKSLGTPHMVNL